MSIGDATLCTVCLIIKALLVSIAPCAACKPLAAHVIDGFSIAGTLFKLDDWITLRIMSINTPSRVAVVASAVKPAVTCVSALPVDLVKLTPFTIFDNSPLICVNALNVGVISAAASTATPSSIYERAAVLDAVLPP